MPIAAKRMRLSKSVVDRLQPAERDYEVADENVPGLYVRVLSTTTRKRGMLRASRRSGVSHRAAGRRQPGVTLRQDLGARPA